MKKKKEVKLQRAAFRPGFLPRRSRREREKMSFQSDGERRVTTSSTLDLQLDAGGYTRLSLSRGEKFSFPVKKPWKHEERNKEKGKCFAIRWPR